MNSAFRHTVTTQAIIPDSVRSFWLAYEQMSDGERAQVIGPSLNKLRSFSTRTSLRLMLAELAAALRESGGFAHKRDIASVVSTLVRALPGGAASLAGVVPVGDDCAAIADGDGYLLFAIEGFINEFVAAEPWFAGYCGVMVNVSDVAAMGGRPIAVVDALWSRGSTRGRA
jgi:hypothetical protein